MARGEAGGEVVKRATRPTRKQLEALIVQHGGNMTKVAEALRVSRSTLYCWTYQLNLADRVGIREAPLPEASTERTTASVRIPGELWRWVRIEAITRGTTTALIVEEALAALRAAGRTA
jgi:hypothetical protein